MFLVGSLILSSLCSFSEALEDSGTWWCKPWQAGMAAVRIPTGMWMWKCECGIQCWLDSGVGFLSSRRETGRSYCDELAACSFLCLTLFPFQRDEYRPIRHPEIFLDAASPTSPAHAINIDQAGGVTFPCQIISCGPTVLGCASRYKYSSSKLFIVCVFTAAMCFTAQSLLCTTDKIESWQSTEGHIFGFGLLSDLLSWMSQVLHWLQSKS